MIHQADEAHDCAAITRTQLEELLERFTSAQTITDVNISAGIALNEVLGVDD